MSFRVLLKSNICLQAFSFAVVMEAMSLRRIEPHLLRKSLWVISVILPFLKISSSQYSVSEHSFKEISNLFIKSALLCAYFASWIFAPIDDEERTI